MQIKITMRKKMILFFLFLVTIPIVIIYLVVSSLFIKNAKNDLINIYAANIREVGKNADIYFNNALDVSIYPLMDSNLKAFLSASADDPDYARIKKNANDILMSMPYGYSTGIYGIRLTTMNLDSISTGSAAAVTAADRTAADMLNSKPYWDYSDSNPKNGHIYMTRLLKNTIDMSEHIGYIKLSLSCTKLMDYIQPNQSDERVSYFLLTSDDTYPLEADENHYRASDEHHYTYTELYTLAHTPVNSQLINDSIISAYALDRTDLVLYSITRSDVLKATKNSFFTTISVVLVMVLFFCIILAVTFSEIITKPLRTLGNHMTSISNEDFTVRYPVKGSDEIAVLTGRFNDMAEKLEFLYSEVYMGELKLKQSQLNMLQTQINPHFLFNTLDTIYWMAKMGESDQVTAMVSNMSKMMRLTLAPKTNDKILLSQELDHLACYIDIQKVRYGKKIDFQLSCDENLRGQYVLSFLLQPLVENALVHGLNNCLDGIVRIRIYGDGENIIYEVSNNGIPIDIDGINNLIHGNSQELKGFAIRNINERLRLKYSNPCRLEYFVKQEFSIFKITQPKENTDD